MSMSGQDSISSGSWKKRKKRAPKMFLDNFFFFIRKGISLIILPYIIKIMKVGKSQINILGIIHISWLIKDQNWLQVVGGLIQSKTDWPKFAKICQDLPRTATILSRTIWLQSTRGWSQLMKLLQNGWLADEKIERPAMASNSMRVFLLRSFNWKKCNNYRVQLLWLWFV